MFFLCNPKKTTRIFDKTARENWYIATPTKSFVKKHAGSIKSQRPFTPAPANAAARRFHARLTEENLPGTTPIATATAPTPRHIAHIGALASESSTTALTTASSATATHQRCRQRFTWIRGPAHPREAYALTSTPRGTDTTVGMQGGLGEEEGEVGDIDWESDAESIDAQVLDMTMMPGQALESRSIAAEGEGVDFTSSPATTKAAATQTISGGDGGESGVHEPGDGTEDTSKTGHGHGDGGKTSPVAALSPPSTPSDRSPELVGWSELLMVDLVLAYFRYYARRRKGYAGRTFCHRSQVRTALCLLYFLCGIWLYLLPTP